MINLIVVKMPCSEIEELTPDKISYLWKCRILSHVFRCMCQSIDQFSHR